VSDQQTGRGIQSATVQIHDGSNANKASVTGTDGSYSLPGLAPGGVTLRIAAAGFTSLTQTVTLTGDRRLDVGLNVLARTIAGTVTDRTSGGVLPNILIAINDGPSAGRTTLTDAGGNFALSGVTSEAVSVTASATGYVSATDGLPAGGDARLDIVLARVAATPTVVIGFGSLGSALPYTESGFTIVSTLSNWIRNGYGNPSPSIQFSGTAAPTIGEVKISAGGASFRFASVDLYSSITQIPYVFTGVANSTTVFVISGQQGNANGNFVTIANPQSTVSIDTLFIRLTDIVPGNPMGIDNIVLR